MDEAVAAALAELGYADCTATAFRPVVPRAGRAPALAATSRAWLRVGGATLLELPTTHSVGMALRAAVRRAAAYVHVYFHDTDLLDGRRAAGARRYASRPRSRPQRSPRSSALESTSARRLPRPEAASRSRTGARESGTNRPDDEAELRPLEAGEQRPDRVRREHVQVRRVGLRRPAEQEARAGSAAGRRSAPSRRRSRPAGARGVPRRPSAPGRAGARAARRRRRRRSSRPRRAAARSRRRGASRSRASPPRRGPRGRRPSRRPRSPRRRPASARRSGSRGRAPGARGRRPTRGRSRRDPARRRRNPAIAASRGGAGRSRPAARGGTWPEFTWRYTGSSRGDT